MGKRKDGIFFLKEDQIGKRRKLEDEATNIKERNISDGII